MNSRRIITVTVVVAAVGLWSGMQLLSADDDVAVGDLAADYTAQLREAAKARAKDPAWKPSCTEVDLIRVGDGKRAGALRNFTLDPEGHILACVAPPRVEPGEPEATEPAAGIRVYTSAGKLLRTLPLPIKPDAIAVGQDGTLFVGGGGRFLKLDPAGNILASAPSPVAHETVEVGPEMDEMIQQMAKDQHGSVEAIRKQMKEGLERRLSEVTGVAATEQDVFLTVPAPNDFTFRVYRFDHALQNPKLVVEKLRGCCGQMDLQAHAGKLWIPHNARHQVECRDRDGKQLAKFGKSGRVKAQDFGGCCEPKNLRVLSSGEILVAESGPPTCIKRFSASGEFLGVVAVVESKGDCVRVTVQASPDGKRFYLLDTERDAIRVFGVKG
jgi:hypothetical protein